LKHGWAGAHQGWKPGMHASLLHDKPHHGNLSSTSGWCRTTITSIRQ
jgi:hypothetical protein